VKKKVVHLPSPTVEFEEMERRNSETGETSPYSTGNEKTTKKISYNNKGRRHALTFNVMWGVRGRKRGLLDVSCETFR
jgi:hypothetical protein